MIVRVTDKIPLDKALRVLKKKLDKEGVIKKMFEKQYYVSRSELRKIKKNKLKRNIFIEKLKQQKEIEKRKHLK